MCASEAPSNYVGWDKSHQVARCHDSRPYRSPVSSTKARPDENRKWIKHPLIFRAFTQVCPSHVKLGRVSGLKPVQTSRSAAKPSGGVSPHQDTCPSIVLMGSKSSIKR